MFVAFESFRRGFGRQGLIVGPAVEVPPGRVKPVPQESPVKRVVEVRVFGVPTDPGRVGGFPVESVFFAEVSGVSRAEFTGSSGLTGTCATASDIRTGLDS